SVSTATRQDREEYLKKLLQILPHSPFFNKWLEKTGELPPDFDALPRVNTLPDPLKFLDGRRVSSTEQWHARRAEIQQLSEKYVWGTFPPKPKIDRVVVLNETHGKGFLVRNVRLQFGPGGKGRLRVQLVIPDGAGPFPVLVCNTLEGWAPAVVRRGYISAGYAANDFMDDAAPLAQLYPDYTFALLPRRAWVVSVVLDYLETLPQADIKHVGMFGYSRNGKTAAIAGAIEERISAVIAGSTGVGGVLPWRSAGECHFAESIETTTREFPTWFAPQLRFFCGREDRLPVDGNLVMALIAPRAILSEWGNNDQVSQTWGDEQAYYSALKVYEMFGVPERVSTMRVPGFHGANDEQACLDWLDIQFDRSSRKWINNLIFEWDWEKWRVNSKESVDLSRFPKHEANDLLDAVASSADWKAKRANLRKSVVEMLGKEPPLVKLPPSKRELAFMKFFKRRAQPPPTEPGIWNPGQVTPELDAWVIHNGGTSYGWLEPQKSLTTCRRITFGERLKGDLYYPRNAPAGAKLPTVIWLHGYSYPLGYMWVYHNDLHPILALVAAGYAVLAYDQSGFGSRLAETGPFYDRYPHWSHMGRMVEDVGAAIDALQKESLVASRQISLFGYSMGGTVALYAAALDSRVQGVVSICGFTPMRTDTVDRGAGGVARYCSQRSLIPRLGFFVGHETRIPYDFDGLLGMIAPRFALVVEPLLDRDATPADVRNAVDRAKKVYALYGAGGKLAIREPWDYNRLPNKTLDETVKWMRAAFV
ncbi:MAG: alpha/beta fold hydrolase, partial [Bryobacteraceae bacterium]